jgi:hypothetical protein
MYHQLYVSPCSPSLLPTQTSPVMGVPPLQHSAGVYGSPYHHHPGPHANLPSQISNQYYPVCSVLTVPTSPVLNANHPGLLPGVGSHHYYNNTHGPTANSAHHSLTAKRVNVVSSHKSRSSHTGQRKRPQFRQKCTSSAQTRMSRVDSTSHKHGHNHMHSDSIPQPNSSSESEYEARPSRSVTSRSRPPHHCSSQFDADVSESSTGTPSGADSDVPGHDSGADSHVDLSNRSVFGSSDVPSDVSSCESNVYCRDVEKSVVQRLRDVPTLPCSVSGITPASDSAPCAGVHLQPACMLSSSRKSAASHNNNNGSGAVSVTHRKVNKPEYLPYSVIKPLYGPKSWDKVLPAGGYVANPPGSPAEDSDQTLSSVDTSGLSPYISGWSHSSDSDSNTRIIPSQRADYPPPAPVIASNVCLLCRRTSQGAYRHTWGENVSPSNRSDSCTVPLLSDTSRLDPTDGPPSEPQDRSPLLPPVLSAHRSDRLLANNSHTRVHLDQHPPYPPFTQAPSTGQQPQVWEHMQTLTKAAGVSDAGPSRGALGSTCSFYCYPSNQQSSSASSSPMHLQRLQESSQVEAQRRNLVLQSRTVGQ